MKEIPLTQGQVALVDDDDYEELNQYKWCAVWSENTNSFYAKRNITMENKKQKGFFMHRVIMGAPHSVLVDHKFHNTLDNRKENLLLVSRSQNKQNGRKYKSNTSGVTGVTWHEKSLKFRADISINKKRKHLGCFDTIKEATKVRKEAEVKYYGKHAYDESKDFVINNKKR